MGCANSTVSACSKEVIPPAATEDTIVVIPAASPAVKGCVRDSATSFETFDKESTECQSKPTTDRGDGTTPSTSCDAEQCGDRPAVEPAATFAAEEQASMVGTDDAEEQASREGADDAEDVVPAAWAHEAAEEAGRLLKQHKVLQAEEVLARALTRLEQAGASAEADGLRATEPFVAAHARCLQYEALARPLGAPSEYCRLVWAGEGSEFWVYAPPGESWFQFKLVCDVDAPLTHCIAYGTEADMIPQHEPNIVGGPDFLGDVSPELLVTRMVIGILFLRVELIYEVCRFYNTEHGFMGESICSDFDKEGRPIPAKHWRNKRVNVNTQFLWIPQGGGKRGTIAVQATRVDTGFKIPDMVLQFFLAQFAPTMVGNLRKNAVRVGSAGSPYAPRLAQDKLGVYAECAKVEEAAARREAYSASSLPDQDWFNRAWRLTDKPPRKCPCEWCPVLSKVSQSEIAR